MGPKLPPKSQGNTHSHYNVKFGKQTEGCIQSLKCDFEDGGGAERDEKSQSQTERSCEMEKTSGPKCGNVKDGKHTGGWVRQFEMRL